MGRRLYRFVSMHPLTARAAVAEGFDFNALREFAFRSYAQLTDEQVRELFDIVRQFVHEVVEYSLGVDAKDLRNYAAHLAELLEGVVRFATPRAAHDMHSPKVASSEPKVPRLLPEVLVAHLDAQNAHLQWLERASYRAGSDELLPITPATDLSPSNLLGLITTLALQVESLASQYDLRVDQLPARQQIVRHGRASMREMLRALHAWAKANELPRSSQRQSKTELSPSPFAQLAYEIMEKSNEWLWGFLRENLDQDHWDAIFPGQDWFRTTAPRTVFFPMPSESGISKFIEDALQEAYSDSD